MSRNYDSAKTIPPRKTIRHRLVVSKAFQRDRSLLRSVRCFREHSISYNMRLVDIDGLSNKQETTKDAPPGQMPAGVGAIRKGQQRLRKGRRDSKKTRAKPKGRMSSSTGEASNSSTFPGGECEGSLFHLSVTRIPSKKER